LEPKIRIPNQASPSLIISDRRASIAIRRH
jgi:hypothetical protein